MSKRFASKKATNGQSKLEAKEKSPPYPNQKLLFEGGDEDGPNLRKNSSPVDLVDNQTSSRNTAKRKMLDDDGEELIFDESAGGDAAESSGIRGEMSKLLESFGSDVNKSLLAKRKRLEQYTQDAMRSTVRTVMESLKIQAGARRKLVEEFRRSLSTYIQQAESDTEKNKEAEEKLQKLIVQQQKHLQQIRIAQCHKLKGLKELGDSFFTAYEELQNKQDEQFGAVESDLKKEMALLQKKILMDTQQQEMMNVRKSLRAMLF